MPAPLTSDFPGPRRRGKIGVSNNKQGTTAMTLTRRHVARCWPAPQRSASPPGRRRRQHGKVIYFIPTLLDEFQSGSRTHSRTCSGAMGYEVTSLDAQNRADLQLNQLEGRDQHQARRDHHERRRLRRDRPRASRRREPPASRC
jgi:hypothetical protein